MYVRGMLLAVETKLHNANRPLQVVDSRFYGYYQNRINDAECQKRKKEKLEHEVQLPQAPNSTTELRFSVVMVQYSVPGPARRVPGRYELASGASPCLPVIGH